MATTKTRVPRTIDAYEVREAMRQRWSKLIAQVA